MTNPIQPNNASPQKSGDVGAQKAAENKGSQGNFVNINGGDRALFASILNLLDSLNAVFASNSQLLATTSNQAAKMTTDAEKELHAPDGIRNYLTKLLAAGNSEDISRWSTLYNDYQSSLQAKLKQVEAGQQMWQGALDQNVKNTQSHLAAGSSLNHVWASLTNLLSKGL